MDFPDHISPVVNFYPLSQAIVQSSAVLAYERLHPARLVGCLQSLMQRVMRPHLGVWLLSATCCTQLLKLHVALGKGLVYRSAESKGGGT